MKAVRSTDCKSPMCLYESFNFIGKEKFNKVLNVCQSYFASKNAFIVYQLSTNQILHFATG